MCREQTKWLKNWVSSSWHRLNLPEDNGEIYTFSLQPVVENTDGKGFVGLLLKSIVISQLLNGFSFRSFWLQQRASCSTLCHDDRCVICKLQKFNRSLTDGSAVIYVEREQQWREHISLGVAVAWELVIHWQVEGRIVSWMSFVGTGSVPGYRCQVLQAGVQYSGELVAHC